LAALSQAQRDGLWLDETTTPPWLLNDVRHASDVANRGRVELYENLMQPLILRFGKDDLQRVGLCVKGVLGFEQLVSGDSKQKPTFMYFPGLPETPFFKRDLFPWFEQLENNFEAIRNEAENILSQKNALLPFLSLS
jgi:aspartate beta-hydroxylase